MANVEKTLLADDEGNKTMTKSNLTAREITILELLAGGVTTNAAIGRALTIHHRTVDNYVSRLIQKTGARNRTELAVRYWVGKHEGERQ